MRTMPLIFACLSALAACSHAAPLPPPAPAKAVAVEPAPPPPPAPKPASPAPLAQLAPVSIYFDYDSSELSPESRTALQAFFDQAQKRPDQGVRIEGNCDERGTREYNLALGQRRADAARKYLENLGMEGTHISAISNGKERPRATGNDEASWKENRRDDVIPSAGTVAAAGIVDLGAH